MQENHFDLEESNSNKIEDLIETKIQLHFINI